MIHEINHIISFLFYVNIIDKYDNIIISDKAYKTILITDKHLKNIQSEFIKKYNDDEYNIKDNYDDLGEIIKILFYGLPLNEYKLFSSIFYLSKQTYKEIVDISIFRNQFCELFKFEKKFSQETISNLFNNKMNYDTKISEINEDFVLNLLKKNILIKNYSKFVLILMKIANFKYSDYEKYGKISQGYEISNFSYIAQTNQYDKLK